MIVPELPPDVVLDLTEIAQEEFAAHVPDPACPEICHRCLRPWPCGLRVWAVTWMEQHGH